MRRTSDFQIRHCQLSELLVRHLVDRRSVRSPLQQLPPPIAHGCNGGGMGRSRERGCFLEDRDVRETCATPDAGQTSAHEHRVEGEVELRVKERKEGRSAIEWDDHGGRTDGH